MLANSAGPVVQYRGQELGRLETFIEVIRNISMIIKVSRAIHIQQMMRRMHLHFYDIFLFFLKIFFLIQVSSFNQLNGRDRSANHGAL